MKHRLQFSFQELEILHSSEETDSIASRLIVNGVLEGEADDFDELRDACGAALQVIGFDASYRPNRAGKVLEALIDRLFIQSG